MPGLFDDLIPNPTVDKVSRGILGEEKGTPKSVSPQGARGVGQIEPGTFKQYALPGENIDNDKDNRAVHRRMIYDFVVNKKMDPGQAATAYFSGEGNVARGGATPWKQNRGDVNESTSSYVYHAERGMKPARRLFDDLIPKTAAPPKKGLFDDLIPKQEPWRVPAANEGEIVHKKRGEPPQGPQRDPGVMDPEIEARLAPQIAINNQNHPLWAQVAKGMVHGAEVVHALQRMGSNLANDYYDKFTVFGDVASGKKSLHDAATQRRVEEAGVLFGSMEVPGGKSSYVGAGPKASAARAAKAGPEAVEKALGENLSVDKSAPLTMPTLDPKSTGEVASIAGQQAVEGALVQEKTLHRDDDVSGIRRGEEGYVIKDASGKSIAEVIVRRKGNEARIQAINPTYDLENKNVNVLPNQLGPAAMRDILRQYQEQNPGVELLTGSRSTGARAKEGVSQETSVTLVPAKTRTPESLGAAATPPVVQEAWAKVPPAPTNEFIQSQDDAFYRLRQSATADRQQVNEILKELPPELKDPQVQKKLFQFSEGDVDFSADRGALTPKEQELYDKYIIPLRKINADLWREAEKMNGADRKGLEDFDPNYMHRIVKGKSREFDPWVGEASESNPIAGYKSTKAASQRERKYFAIESASGQRKVVVITDHGPMIMEKGQPARPLPKYEGTASQPGDKFKLNGQEWTVGQAKTSEITGAGGPEYYQNAMASLLKNNLQLKAVVRAQYELERLKGTPEFAAYSVMDNQYHSNPNLYEGWRTVDIPIYRGRRFEPRFADAIDDFWKGNQPMLPKLAAINRFAVMSMFWTPVGHAANAGAHWFSERGWDNVTGWRSLAVDGAKAIKAVVTQNKDYQNFLREGGGLVYGSVANTEFYGDMLKALGEDVKRHPAAWDPIARVFGVGPSDLVKMLYGTSARTLWATSDVFMMQRYYELMRKGKSVREAIAEAEKHIPNYRIPPQVMGSRGAAQILKNPNIFEFSKYHYGQLKSIAHMAKDIANVKDPKLMFDTAGKIFATAFLMYFVTPVISSGLQKLLKDENVEYGPKGSTAIPEAIIDAYQGKKSYTDVIQRLFSLSPVLHTGLEIYSNKDMFTGKSIIEPGDVQQHRWGRVGAQVGEELAQNLVSPYSTLSRGVEEREGRGSLVGDIAKQALGARKIPKVWHGGQARERDKNAVDAAKRHARPRGLIEEGEKKLEEKYGGTQ